MKFGTFSIHQVDGADEKDLRDVRTMFTAYAEDIGVDLCFQNFEGELASLPGRYAGPDGSIWVSYQERIPTAIVAVRPLMVKPLPPESLVSAQAFHEIPPGEHCELKRLYVRPEARGSGLGRHLTEIALDFAIQREFDLIYLDTLASMTSAIRLYESLGFEEIPAYTYNPLLYARYFQKKLKNVQGQSLASATDHVE